MFAYTPLMGDRTLRPVSRQTGEPVWRLVESGDQLDPDVEVGVEACFQLG